MFGDEEMIITIFAAVLGLTGIGLIIYAVVMYIINRKKEEVVAEDFEITQSVLEIHTDTLIR